MAIFRLVQYTDIGGTYQAIFLGVVGVNPQDNTTVMGVAKILSASNDTDFLEEQ